MTDGIGRGQGWYVELEPMKTTRHWYILWNDQTRSLGRSSAIDEIVVTDVYAVDATDTWDFDQWQRIGLTLGLYTYVRSGEYVGRPAGQLSYAQVHRDIWNRLAKRGELLAKRRAKS